MRISGCKIDAYMCSEITPKVENGQLTSSHSGPIVFPKTLSYKCDKDRAQLNFYLVNSFNFMKLKDID